MHAIPTVSTASCCCLILSARRAAEWQQASGSTGSVCHVRRKGKETRGISKRELAWRRPHAQAVLRRGVASWRPGVRWALYADRPGSSGVPRFGPGARPCRRPPTQRADGGSRKRDGIAAPCVVADQRACQRAVRSLHRRFGHHGGQTDGQRSDGERGHGSFVVSSTVVVPSRVSFDH